jgi:hypothetical protein
VNKRDGCKVHPLPIFLTNRGRRTGAPWIGQVRTEGSTNLVAFEMLIPWIPESLWLSARLLVQDLGQLLSTTVKSSTCAVANS